MAKFYNQLKQVCLLFRFQNSLYISFNIPWLITGNKDNVAKVNQRIVVLKEAELKIIGLGAYLKNNYLQFYK